MKVKVVRYENSVWLRDVEKNLSREMDCLLISSGESSVADLAVQNDMFASLNLSGFKVSAIGGRVISKVDD